MASPAAGFEALLVSVKRRDRTTAARLSEGVAPYVLSAVGGGAAMLLWLKTGSLIGVRELAPSDFRWAALTTAVVAGALVTLLAQFLWASIGARILGDTRHSPARDLRVVWGVAAFPQALTLLVLVPLDLLIAGPATYATTRLGDSVEMTWAAVSIACAVALGAWSLYLFFAGLRVVAHDDGRKVAVLITVALVSTGVVVLAFSFLLITLARALQ